MKIRDCILIFCFLAGFCEANSQQKRVDISFNFLGTAFTVGQNPFDGIKYTASLSQSSIVDFYQELRSTRYQQLVNAILDHRDKQNLDDWLYYQLVRRTAQQLSPKAENYFSYTLYKWFLLTQSGYDALIRISADKMLFYVQCDEMIYNIPYIVQNNKQYVCLNYHDYGNDIDFNKEQFSNVIVEDTRNKKAFTYKVNHLPDADPAAYIKKDIQFTYYNKQYQFNIKLNPEIKSLFTNYPTADYSNQFSIPLSKETYNSLIPQLKEVVDPMTVTQGVDYLMRFTRYSFLYEKDTLIFGREKRLSAEETLLYDRSDCEDRAALFFCLVKEIYNLPMIVLSYPHHVTVAVKFDKPVGKPILYNGESYYVCEPTPQKKDLHMGKMLPELKKESFEVAYVYHPGNR